ncbi:prolipoprotein diacylglyceryl transferase [Anaeroselena agilis]|uniref:Phosphatidylglycerol--prolipoprotein diacylglyceryl transferase n=1 Tax=Anaeroselena agilis TaxID=3063788 RepID=A0ABU3NZI6_9FIRM|nr:prolipoprotein diacylglyceryl transferase [Selenomonadales bacterium 4137-cl]
MGKIAFTLGPLQFYWYGLIIAVAVTAAFLVFLWQAARQSRPVEPVVDLLFWSVPAGVIGARVYYVAANWSLYRDRPLDSLCLWQGGLAIHGALLAFILVLYIYARRRRIPFWEWADLAAPALACGQAVGQWANFFNQEAFGPPTDLAWGVYIDYALRPAGYEQFDFFHPVFMYESGWNLFLLLALLAAGRVLRRFRPGAIFLTYIILYSAGHYYFAGLRLDGETILGIGLAQIFSVLAAVAALGLLLGGRRPRAEEQ